MQVQQAILEGTVGYTVHAGTVGYTVHAGTE